MKAEIEKKADIENLKEEITQRITGDERSIELAGKVQELCAKLAKNIKIKHQHKRKLSESSQSKGEFESTRKASKNQSTLHRNVSSKGKTKKRIKDTSSESQLENYDKNILTREESKEMSPFKKAQLTQKSKEYNRDNRTLPRNLKKLKKEVKGNTNFKSVKKNKGNVITN